MTSAEGSNALNVGTDDSDYDSDRGYEVGRPENKHFICGVVEGERLTQLSVYPIFYIIFYPLAKFVS